MLPRYGACLMTSRGSALPRVRTALSCAERAVPDRTRSFRDLPRVGRESARRRGLAAVRRGGVSRVPALWLAGRRVRAVPLHLLRPGSARRVLVQRARLLSELRRPQDGRARGAGLPARPRTPGGRGEWSGRRGGGGPTVRGCAQSERARACAGPRWSLREGPLGCHTLSSRFSLHRPGRGRGASHGGAADQASAQATRSWGSRRWGGAPDAWAEEAPVLAGLAAASVQGTVALGRSRGARLRRLGDSTEEDASPALGHCHARSDGFDLHAGVVVPAGQRERLERVCRYALRPPVAADRVRVTENGQVVLQLRHRWADGTTHLVFDPVEFLGRLAVLVPRPRINLILYHGVLAPRAAWRREVVRRAADGATGETAATDAPHGAAEAADEACPQRAGGRLWADLMRRSFGFDVLECPRCGGAPASDGSHRAGCGDRADPPSSRPARRGPRPLCSVGAAVADRLRLVSHGRRRHRLRSLLVTGDAKPTTNQCFFAAQAWLPSVVDATAPS